MSADSISYPSLVAWAELPGIRGARRGAEAEDSRRSARASARTLDGENGLTE